MKTLLSTVAVLSAALAAHAATLTWDPNPQTDLVTNYVVQASGPVTNSYNVGVATTFALGALPGGGQWTINVLAQNAVGTSDPSLPYVWSGPVAPGPVSGIVVNANWTAGAFDITATWQSATNAASYVAQLLNTATGAGIPRSVTTTSASWPRVPSGTYRLSIYAVSGSGTAGPTATVNLGTIRPGRPGGLR